MSITKHISSTIGANVLNLLFNIANSVLLARLLGVEGRGEYAFFIASTSLMALVFGFGSSSGSIFFSAKEKTDSHRLLFVYFIQSLLFSVLLFFIFYFVNKNSFQRLFLPENLLHSSVFILLVVSVFMQLMGNIFSGILTGNLLIHRVNAVKVAHVVITFLAYAYLYFISDKLYNTTLLINVYVLLQLLLLMVYVFLFYKCFGLPKSLRLFSFNEYKKMFFWGGIAYFATIFQFLNYRLDFWFVEYYKGIHGLGIYSLSSGLAQLLWVFPSAVTSVIFPYVSGGSEKFTPEKAALIARVVSFLSFFISIIAIISTYWIIPLFYGKDFTQSYGVFCILLFGTMPFCVTNVIAGYFSGRNMVKINLWASFIGFLLTVILDIIFIPIWGLQGAAFASVISYLSTTFWVIFKFYKLFQIPFWKLYFFTFSDINDIRQIIKR
jgi:O-antigen/teichoic acid export membrane protein